jgi:hypothetical protein
MTEKLSLVIMSHMSDIQSEVSEGKCDAKCVLNQTNFVKFLISRHTNLNSEIDINEEWDAFTKTIFYKA